MSPKIPRGACRPEARSLENLGRPRARRSGAMARWQALAASSLLGQGHACCRQGRSVHQARRGQSGGDHTLDSLRRGGPGRGSQGSAWQRRGARPATVQASACTGAGGQCRSPAHSVCEGVPPLRFRHGALLAPDFTRPRFPVVPEILMLFVRRPAQRGRLLLLLATFTSTRCLTCVPPPAPLCSHGIGRGCEWPADPSLYQMLIDPPFCSLCISDRRPATTRPATTLLAPLPFSVRTSGSWSIARMRCAWCRVVSCACAHVPRLVRTPQPPVRMPHLRALSLKCLRKIYTRRDM
jgi:hypothetical protein